MRLTFESGGQRFILPVHCTELRLIQRHGQVCRIDTPISVDITGLCPQQSSQRTQDFGRRLDGRQALSAVRLTRLSRERHFVPSVVSIGRGAEGVNLIGAGLGGHHDDLSSAGAEPRQLAVHQLDPRPAARQHQPLVLSRKATLSVTGSCCWARFNPSAKPLPNGTAVRVTERARVPALLANMVRWARGSSGTNRIAVIPQSSTRATSVSRLRSNNKTSRMACGAPTPRKYRWSGETCPKA
jgi:hypothetical protein